jgi:hypothetical protein
MRRSCGSWVRCRADSTSNTLAHDVTHGQKTAAIASNVSSTTYGQTVHFTVTVTALAPAVGVPSGSVTILSNGATLGRGPVHAGAATFETALHAGIDAFRYLRIVPISRAANSSSGGLSEKWGVAYHGTRAMLAKNKHAGTFIQYAPRGHREDAEHQDRRFVARRRERRTSARHAPLTELHLPHNLCANWRQFISWILCPFVPPPGFCKDAWFEVTDV